MNTYDGRLFMKKSGSTGESIVSFVSFEELTGSLFSGSISITGSLVVTAGITGSLQGTATTASFVTTAQTASYVLQAVSASFATTSSFVKNAQTASYILQAVSSSFATTASYVLGASNTFPYTGSAIISGSLQIIGAITGSTSLSGSLLVSGSTVLSGSLNVTSGITGSIRATNGIYSSSAQVIGNVTTAGSTFTFQYLVLGSGTNQGRISTDGSKPIQIIPNGTTQTAQFWPNGNVTLQNGPGNTFVDNGYRLQLIGTGSTSSGSLFVSGSSVFSGSLTSTVGFTGSLQGTAETASYVVTAQTASYVLNAVSASFATTASFVLGQSPTASFALTASYVANAQTASFVTTAQTASYVLNAVSSSFATTASYLLGQSPTASYALTASYADNFTVGNTLTAQRIVVQTISSSIVYSSGSNRFGNDLTNTQSMTGSVGISGSLAVNGVSAVLGSGTTNYVAKFTSSTAIGNSNIQDTGTLITLGSSTTISSGGLGIGTAALSNRTLNVAKNITGGVISYGIEQSGVVQTDVTTSAIGFNTVASTVASSFTLSQYFHYSANQGTIGSGSAITSQIGFDAASTLIGAANNFGFRGRIPAGTNRWNLYMDGTANNYMAGSLGIGSTSLGGISLNITKALTGGTSAYGVNHIGSVQSDVTSVAFGFQNNLLTQAAAFTLGNYWHFAATQNTIGAGSAVTTQIGFRVDATLIGATNNYGFNGNIPAGTNRWNLYMGGTASNYLAGYTGIGTTTLGTSTALTVGGTETASSAIARGQLINPTLVASANGDVLVGLDINPTFTNGAFTGVNNFGIRVAAGTGIQTGIITGLNNLRLTTVGISSNIAFSLNQTSFEIGRFHGTTGNFTLQNGGTFTDNGFRLEVSGPTRLNGLLTVVSASIQSQNTSSLASGTQTISTNATGSFTAAFYNYTVASGSNTRAGQFIATWNGSSLQYMDNSTLDIGNTSAVALTGSLSGANVLLTSTLPSNGWTIKTLVDLI